MVSPHYSLSCTLWTISVLSPATDTQQVSWRPCWDSHKPVRFSLPLSLPSSLSPPSLSAAASDVKVVGFFGEPGLEVVDVCYSEDSTRQVPLVLSYNSASRQHHIWALQQATREVCSVCVHVHARKEVTVSRPIQDIPAHLTTPQRPQTPVKPLSTSAPSCYGNEATPMMGLMNTPVEMILSMQRPRGTGSYQE